MRFIGAKEKGKVQILGIPYDSTTCFRPGTRFAPDGIRFFSDNLEEYSLPLGKSLEEVEFCDLGNLYPSTAPEKMVDEVYEAVRKMEIPVILGGEHSITFPVLRALSERYENLTVVHFDAHADLRDDYSGTKYSHACVMRRVLELGVQIVQLGVRSATREEAELRMENTNIKVVETFEELKSLVSKIEMPVYFSIDIDFFDPAFAPGTGTPEPPGFSPVEFFNFIYKLPDVNVVGFDVVEVSPPYDPSGTTQMLAAKIVRELILKFWG
ncbi:agmatinase [Balnearium lithotrophicum]|uniref:Agmatinase n=1 Tax=Balnearium lithotrophicum TaxID=223788 RepID=A0A521CV63_9BACT|nr:agmatinase [Balnearium lithotrophicum]SMO63313.1 agmatinase [Balnearium lithotrophicum]